MKLQYMKCVSKILWVVLYPVKCWALDTPGISAFLSIHHFHRAVVLSVSSTLAALAGETGCGHKLVDVAVKSRIYTW